MTRRQKLTIRLVLYIFLFVFVLCAGVQLVQHDWSRSHTSADRTAVASETWRTQEVQNIKTDLTACSVEILPNEADEVCVEIYREGLGNYVKPETSLKDGVLTIVEEARLLNFSMSNCKVLIYVPEHTALSYQLKTVSGGIKLHVKSATADLSSTSGSVKVWESGGALSADSVSGSIKVYAPFESMKLNTTSGSVKAVADAQTKSAHIDTTSGSVKLSLTNDVTGYTMQYSSVSGSVRDMYRNADFGKNGTTDQGDGALDINIKTVSGSIKLTDWSIDD